MDKLYGNDKQNILLPDNLYIPELSDERLINLYRRIKPIVTINDEKYTLREFSLDELKNISYIYSCLTDKEENIDVSKLKDIKDFVCLHTYGYFGFFKPSIYEVLSQIPDDIINDINYFEIIESPNNLSDIKKYYKILQNGFHLSKVRTYKRKYI